MIDQTLPILIVDDARFSSAVIMKHLKEAGYQDIRNVSSGQAALDEHEKRPASIIISDWLMPKMDGLELTRQIRQIDEVSNHYTYVVLLTAREGIDALSTAFNEGVDDFINKSSMTEQLIPRVMAGNRLSQFHHRMIADHQTLLDHNKRLKNMTTIDPLTGLGNLAYAQSRITDAIKQTEKRDGSASIFIMEISNYDRLQEDYPKTVHSQVLLAFSRRFRQLVRPLDIVCRISKNQFVMIAHHANSEDCTASSFKRIYEKLRLQAYKTTSGYVLIEIACALVSTTTDTGLPSHPNQMLETAIQKLKEARVSQVIEEATWTPEVDHFEMLTD